MVTVQDFQDSSTGYTSNLIFNKTIFYFYTCLNYFLDKPKLKEKDH